MKIRKSFVTNSSSTSYCLWSVDLKDWDGMVDLGKLNDLGLDADPDCSYSYSFDEILYVKNIMKEYPELKVLSNIYDYDTGWKKLGACPSEMREDETLGEFKERVIKAINKFLELSAKDNVEPKEVKDLDFFLDHTYS